MTLTPTRRSLLATGTAFAAALALPCAPALAATRFRDVPRSHLFYSDIEWLAARGITTGWPDGTFRPRATIKRDAFAAFLFRLCPTSYRAPSRSPFRDVRTTDMFYREMAWMRDMGISTGWTDGTFRPLNPVNRDAVAAFLYRLAGSPSYTPPRRSPFRDVTPRTQFYKEICWLASKKVTTGWPDGTFRPTSSITREAMAAFLHRYVLNVRNYCHGASRRTSSPAPAPAPKPAPKPTPKPAPKPGVYYENCDAVRRAGQAPLLRGEPGYRRALDRDGDGRACEPKP